MTKRAVGNFESNEFIFRELRQSDAAVLFDIYSNAEAMRFRGSRPMSKLEDAFSFINNQSAETAQYFVVRQGVEWKGNNLLIGSVMYKFDKHRDSECEIGYSIGSNHWGQGFGRKIVSDLLESLTERGEIKKVKAWTIKENLASKRILELNGFAAVHQQEYPESFLYCKYL